MPDRLTGRPRPGLLGLLLLLAAACGGGEEPTLGVDDLTARLAAEGVAVEDGVDLAEVGAVSRAGRMHLLTLEGGTSLLVHVADDEATARRLVQIEAGSPDAARRMGVADADTYSSGTTFGNLAVLLRDDTDPAEAERVLEALER